MTKLAKAISLGMAAAMLTASLPNLAAADDDRRGRRHDAREYRDDNRRDHRGDWRYKKERHAKHYKKERRQRHAEKRRHKKVVVRKHHDKRVVVHKHKRKHRRSYDPWPLLAVVGITAAYLHANAAQAQPEVRYVEPLPAPVPQTVAAVQPEPQGPTSTCLMTREYQTQIVVNGKLVDGYGDACLQPDGSWYRGPAVAVNY